MSFLRFIILSEKEDQQLGYKELEMLINRDHIVSIKPINITLSEGRVVKGHWIRNSNGKKYKATQIPKDIEDMFEFESNAHIQGIEDALSLDIN